MNAPPRSPRAIPRAKGFPRHAAIFGGLVSVAILANFAFGLGLPLFWPIGAWALGLAIHFFIASTEDVPEEWIEERASDVKLRSYDFGHIHDIQQRAEEKHASVTHREEQRRQENPD